MQRYSSPSDTFRVGSSVNSTTVLGITTMAHLHTDHHIHVYAPISRSVSAAPTTFILVEINPISNVAGGYAVWSTEKNGQFHR